MHSFNCLEQKHTIHVNLLRQDLGGESPEEGWRGVAADSFILAGVRCFVWSLWAPSRGCYELITDYSPTHFCGTVLSLLGLFISALLPLLPLFFCLYSRSPAQEIPMCLDSPVCAQMANMHHSLQCESTLQMLDLFIWFHKRWFSTVVNLKNKQTNK